MRTLYTEIKLAPITIAYIAIAASLFPFYADSQKSAIEIVITMMTLIVYSFTLLLYGIARVISWFMA
jgi:hypothetical protein